MIDREHDLPLTRQATVLRISRGSVYYLPRPVLATDLELMRRLDRLHLEFPFAGSRMLRGLLVAEGCKIGRRHVKTLMKRMGIEALYRRPRTDEAGARPQDLSVSVARDRDHATEPGVGDGHHLHSDGTRLRLLGGRAGLVQPSRASLARLNHDGGGVLRRDAAGRACSPRQAGYLQHRQGSQFTGSAFTGVLANNGIAISMDGKGLGGTTSSSSGCGAASNTRKFICGPTTASAKRVLRSAAIWIFTTAADPTRALTAPHPIKPTSPRCLSAGQPDHGRTSTYRCGDFVRTTGTTAIPSLILIRKCS